MSRKSRRRAAERKLRHTAPPAVALIILLAGLFLGTMFALPERIVPREEAVRVTAALQEAQGVTRRRTGSRNRKLNTIRLCFSDHDPLFIRRAASTEELLAALSALPEGTVCDMLVPPGGATLLSLHIGGQEVITYADTAEQIARGNAAGPLIGLFFFLMGGYGAWSLLMRWQYRRTPASQM